MGKQKQKKQQQKQQVEEIIVNMKGKCNVKSNNETNNNEADFYLLNEEHDNKTMKRRLNDNGSNLSDGEGSGTSSSGHGDSSNFSSSSSAASDEETNESNQSISSGRSSADQTLDLVEGTENGWNFVPQRHEAIEFLDQIRTRFLSNLKEPEQLEELDLLELQKPIPSHEEAEQLYGSLAVRLISRFVDTERLIEIQETMEDQNEANKSIEKTLVEATEKLHEFLLFRHHYHLTNVLTDQFCKEIYQLHGIFPFGCDKNQLPVLYLRARVHRRWSGPLDESFKRYVAWQVDLITKSNHDSGQQVKRSLVDDGRIIKDGSFGICFDCLNVSYSCVDMDFLSYLVKILVHYYPTYCRYALCVDLPWLFRSVWKLVRSWLPEEAQSSVHLITSKQLTEFIDENQIPNSMKINDLAGAKKSISGKHKLPAEFETLKNFDEFAKELNLSSSEIKHFKSHMEKVLKEYEQLGAI